MKALFFPEYPQLELYTIVAIFNRLDYFATQDPDSDFDFAVAWQDSTWVDTGPLLKQISETKCVVNLDCTDISKEYVEQISRDIFGYQTLVDPRVYDGVCVKKPNENAVERGKIIKCPIDAPETGYVYQRFIDAREQDGYKTEYRVPVTFDRLTCVYVQKKKFHHREAKTVPERTHLQSPGQVFSTDEQAKIIEFCRRIGLDFGDLDVLRDFRDGRLYILDANKTGGGFGLLNRFRWSIKNRKQAIKMVAEGFDRGIRTRLNAFAKPDKSF
jgi:hypothetical protein